MQCDKKHQIRQSKGLAKKGRNKRQSRRHKHEASSFAERQGEPSTSCPGAMRRQKRVGEGDGTWVAYTHLHSFFEEICSHGWHGKLALAPDKAPSRGEPGEPRGLYTDLRTPSPKLGGTSKQVYEHKKTQKKQFHKRHKKQRNERKDKPNRNKHRNERRKTYRRLRSEAPGETGGGWPPKLDDFLRKPQNWLVKAITRNKKMSRPSLT